MAREAEYEMKLKYREYRERDRDIYPIKDEDLRLKKNTVMKCTGQ